jgi:hypothetical protein
MTFLMNRLELFGVTQRLSHCHSQLCAACGWRLKSLPALTSAARGVFRCGSAPNCSVILILYRNYNTWWVPHKQKAAVQSNPAVKTTRFSIGKDQTMIHTWGSTCPFSVCCWAICRKFIAALGKTGGDWAGSGIPGFSRLKNHRWIFPLVVTLTVTICYHDTLCAGRCNRAICCWSWEASVAFLGVGRPGTTKTSAGVLDLWGGRERVKFGDFINEI